MQEQGAISAVKLGGAIRWRVFHNLERVAVVEDELSIRAVNFDGEIKSLPVYNPARGSLDNK